MKEYIALEQLVGFLRHDFDQGDEDTLNERMHIELDWGFGLTFDPGWIVEATALQKEITDDLNGVLTDKCNELGDSPIAELIRKINSMNLQPEWGVHWVSPAATDARFKFDKAFLDRRQRAIREAYKRFIRSQGKHPTAKRLKDTMNEYPLYGRKSDMQPLFSLVDNALREFNAVRPPLEYYPVPIHHRPGQGILKIGAKKFYITRDNYTGTPRQRLYGVIIEALEEGYLPRLRSCRQCQAFFVAKDLKRKFCTPACMRIADQKGAAERVRKMRARNKRVLESARKKQTLVQVAAQPKNEPPKRFVEFFNIATKHNQTKAEQSRILPYLKALGGGEAPAGWQIVGRWEGKGSQKPSCQNVWRQLDPRSQRVFRE